MHILILGAAGMIGRKLTARLVADGNVGGRAIERLTLADVVAPQQPEGAAGQVESVAADLSAPGEAERLVAGRPDVIVHLAAVVSGEAEADFDKGYRVNLDGTRALLDAVRARADGYRPRLVFTSSIAVYGPPLPDPIPEDFQQAPLTSYGTQKAIGELLLADYTRRGFVDGVGHPAADDLHPPGQAEQGRVRLLLQHPARAAGRPGGGAAGAGDRPALARLARARRWASWSTRRRSTVSRSVRAGPCRCPASAPPSASRSRRCAGSPGSGPSG